MFTDIREERERRQRILQVDTAKCVIKRFCPDKILKFDKGTMTETE